MLARRAISHRWASVRLLGILALTVAFAAIGAASASAQEFTPSNTAEFEADITDANLDGEANTIVLAAEGFYHPAMTIGTTLAYSSKHPLIIEGPAGPSQHPGAILAGSSIAPYPQPLLVLKKEVAITLRNVEVEQSGGVSEPAIKLEKGAVLTVESSTIASNAGAGVELLEEATADVSDSTFSSGLGIGILAQAASAVVNLVSSTVAFNHGGGLSGSGEFNLTNTIVAGNTSLGHPDCAFHVESQVDSIDSDGSCGVTHTYTVEALKLDEHLLPDGGTTLLNSLQTRSPAIGGGQESSCLATDQEGETREPGRCDVGADEWNGITPTIEPHGEVTEMTTASTGTRVRYVKPQASSTVATVREVNCSPHEPGSNFEVGKTKVTCTAKDGHGNEASTSFEVDVVLESGTTTTTTTTTTTPTTTTTTTTPPPTTTTTTTTTTSTTTTTTTTT